jgi:hypothetical protein
MYFQAAADRENLGAENRRLEATASLSAAAMCGLRAKMDKMQVNIA